MEPVFRNFYLRDGRQIILHLKCDNSRFPNDEAVAELFGSLYRAGKLLDLPLRILCHSVHKIRAIRIVISFQHSLQTFFELKCDNSRFAGDTAANEPSGSLNRAGKWLDVPLIIIQTVRLRLTNSCCVYSVTRALQECHGLELRLPIQMPPRQK